MDSTFDLSTTHYGVLRGNAVESVVEFLGVPYAELRDRLADAELIKTRQGGILDATKDGPTAISPRQGCHLEQEAIQHTLPPKDLPQSDRHCLNLNITTPRVSLQSKSKLPVFVFIHGGGYALGANSWPQYSLQRLNELSVRCNRPVVTVGINYRLGVFGFLTSTELREAGYSPNNGLRDQRVAIEWVHRHIQCFGGDPSNITIAGSSAGGASALLHLHSETPLFRQLISLSGTYLLLRPTTLDAQERAYQKALDSWGLSAATPGERIRYLLETPAEELFRNCSISVMPSIDGDLIPTDTSFAEVADPDGLHPIGKKWCQSILIGDAAMDASIIDFVQPELSRNCAARFIKLVNTNLPQAAAVALLQKYHLLDEDSDSQAFLKILDYLNHVTFNQPSLAFSMGWSNRAHLYYFNEGNPWDGPYQEKATHLLDIAYLTQNFSEFLSKEQNELALRFAEDILKFCHGLKPWPATGTNFHLRLYGPTHAGCMTKDSTKPFGPEVNRQDVMANLPETVSRDTLISIAEQFKSI